MSGDVTSPLGGPRGPGRQAETSRRRLAMTRQAWVKDPMATVATVGYFTGMNTLLIIFVLLLLFGGGGGFYFGGPVIGGSGLGLILLICLVVFLMGGFRTTKK